MGEGATRGEHTGADAAATSAEASCASSSPHPNPYPNPNLTLTLTLTLLTLTLTLTRPRSAIQPATIKMLAAAGLPPHAVKASVGAKKLDYLYAAYTLVTEQPLTL